MQKARQAARAAGCRVGEMKDGVTFEQASAEMKAITARQAEAYPDTNKGWTLRPMPLRQFVHRVTLTRQYTILLLGAVGFRAG